MNILMVYQSVVDMGASIFMLLITVVKVDGTRMSRKSTYDQFLCIMWIGKQPLWCFLTQSTYGILLTALDRYIAVLYPLWYKNNVRTVTPLLHQLQSSFSLLSVKGSIYASIVKYFSISIIIRDISVTISKIKMIYATKL